MNPVILQNQALYLTTLHNRATSWSKCRESSYKLARASSQLLEHSKLSAGEQIALKAALDILENELLGLDNKHKTKDK